MSFQVILLDLMKECNITSKQLSKKTGIPENTINSWFNAHRYPDFYSTIRLCDFFGVSDDYLLGISKVKETPKINIPVDSLSSDEKKLLDNYRALNTKNKIHVSEYMSIRREEQENSELKCEH